MSDERIKIAFEAFVSGFRAGAVPTWEAAPTWVRDAMRVAYLQGKLDAAAARSHKEAAGGSHD